MSVRLEWTETEYVGVSLHRKGDELADGNRVDTALALAIGPLVIGAKDYVELVKLVERIENALGLAGFDAAALKSQMPEMLNVETDNVYLVVKTMSDDGIYVFADEQERDEFFDACGGDEDDTFSDVTKTDEPIIAGKTARDIIAAQRGE